MVTKMTESLLTNDKEKLPLCGFWKNPNRGVIHKLRDAESENIIPNQTIKITNWKSIDDFKVCAVKIAIVFERKINVITNGNDPHALKLVNALVLL